MRARTWIVAALLSASGFCALVYQVGWLREFRLIFGASTAASAAVLAIFIGGLGVGGLLLGPRADHHPRPLLFYAQLEAIVAISAAVSPMLLLLVRTAYVAIGGTPTVGLVAGTIGRLVLSALVLAVPTVAMGGTLPAAARAATRLADTRRQDLAALYALNTLGAVAGSVIATFTLLEVYGTRATLWLAALLNLLVALTARAIDRRWAGDAEAARDAPDPAHAVRPARSAPAAFVLIASGTVGFAFFLMELVWYRLLGPLLGGSVFTFGLVLAIALAGIGAGGLLYALTSRDRDATLAGFATTCLLESLAVGATFAIGDRLAILTMVLLPLRAGGFAASVFGWTLITSIVVLPPAIVAGYQFPMLIALLGRAREHLGRQVGLTYAANTAGAIAGSLAGGFGLLPWLTAPGAWRLVAASLLALGIVAAILARQNLRGRDAAPLALVAFAALFCLTRTGPTAVWRHSGIGAGRAIEGAFNAANALTAWQHANRNSLYWDGDGVESSIAVMLDGTGYAFFVNGKSDGAARGDAGTQVMLGLLGALRKPDAKRALVVGLGTGSSAGWLAAVPAIERVDVVELEPLVLRVARDCAPVNHGAMTNPKVRITVGDARETLLTTRERYDIIASEPSNPFRAGVASLFTVEFYRALDARLTDDGVVAQWVQGYEIDAPTLRSIYATMATVFPQIEAWQTRRGDLVLVGAKRPATYSAAALAARLKEEPFKSAVAHVWRTDTIEGLLSHYVAGDAVARAFARGPAPPVNTDDRNTVEFGFARSVGVPSGSMPPELRRVARLLDAARPPLSDGGNVNWPSVDTARAAYNAVQGYFDEPPIAQTPEERSRQTAYMRLFQGNNVVGARAAWDEQSGGVRDLSDARLLAAIEAESGSDLALDWIERIRVYEPAEADALVAKLRFRQGRDGEAVTALTTALTGFRTDPWVTQSGMTNAMNLVTAIADRYPPAARPLMDALREPFTVHALNTTRLMVAGELSRRAEFGTRCAEFVHPFEPNPVWAQPFLTLRRDCYRATGDERVLIAERDLDDFLRREPSPLAR